MKLIRKTTETVIVILFSVLVISVLIQVIARYIFNNPPSWTEELARYCQVWIIMLASSICIKNGSHLAVDYLSRTLSKKSNYIIELIISILTIMYLFIVIIFGIKLMLVGVYQVSPAIQLKMSFVYAIFPIGGFLMFLEAVIKVITSVKIP